MTFSAYTAERPRRLATTEELRARIPGWGADLDPADRPAVPKERFDSSFAGAHWDFPERQEEKYPRERSLEHRILTPVFGTVMPPKGLSGAIRRLAYRRYSEGKVAHWLLLIVGDRVDATGAHLRSLLTLRPDNPITESGVLGEIGHHPISSRFGKKRADTKHMWMDPIIVAGPWVLAGGVLLALARTVMRGRRSG